jgi:hypothetical protein
VIDRGILVSAHLAGSATKPTGNGAQHGVAVAAAAYLCNESNTTPRAAFGLVEARHEREVQFAVSAMAGDTTDEAVFGQQSPKVMRALRQTRGPKAGRVVVAGVRPNGERVVHIF